MKPQLALFLPLVLIAIALMGCPKSDSEGGAPATASNGQAIYEKNGCGSCHSGNAPSLDRIGTEHDSAWIVAHIKNPKTHKPNSRMPGYEGKISEADLKTLGDYLASKK